MREVRISYIAKRPNYTIGRLYIDGKYMCDTLTPPYRGIYVKGCTSVPKGEYKLSMGYVSPRFSSKEPYRSIANGKVPRVVGFSGSNNILIHCGNTARDTEGCFLLGQNKEVGKVVNSVLTYKKVVAILAQEKEWKLIIEGNI